MRRITMTISHPFAHLPDFMIEEPTAYTSFSGVAHSDVGAAGNVSCKHWLATA